MNVQVKTSNGITLVPLETKHLTERRIFVQGSITQESACEFIKEILFLNSQDQKAPIDVLINSPGGSINAGLLMYDAVQSSPAPVRMFCMGQAYSMGAVLFVGGKHGRYMLPHSELMLHEPAVGNIKGGNTSSIRSISESLMEIRKKINQILVIHTGQNPVVIEEQTSFDHFFGPEESIAFGLADQIVGFDMLLEGKNGER